MRGGSEDALLVRSRPSKEAGAGGQGDDFWRRFSMVAHQAETKRHSAGNSSWLAKTQAGARRLSIWIWVIGIIVLVAIGVGVTVGVKANQNKPAHQDPVAIGGGAHHSMDSSSTSTVGGLTKHYSITPNVHTATLAARALTQAVVQQTDSSAQPTTGPSVASDPSPSASPALHVVHRRRRDKHYQHMRRG